MSNFWKNFGKLVDVAVTSAAVYHGNAWINSQAERITNNQTRVNAMIDIAFQVGQMDNDTWNALHTGLLAKSINNTSVGVLKDYCTYVVSIEIGELRQLMNLNIDEGTRILLNIFQQGNVSSQCAYLGLLKAKSSNVKASYMLNNLIDARNRSVPKAIGQQLPIGKFNRIWLEFNVYNDSVHGFIIHVDFTISNAIGKGSKLLAWFYDARGQKLPDSNGKYVTTDGQVCVAEAFTPKYDSSHFEDFSIFMPYQELHITKAGKQMFKFYIGMFAGHDNLATSEYVNFDITFT